MSKRGNFNDSWRHYRVFGIGLCSDFPFRTCLPPDLEARETDLSFTCRVDFPPLEPLSQAPLYESPFRTRKGARVLLLYRVRDGYLMRFPGAGDFFLSGKSVLCRPLTTEPRAVEVRLLGSVMAFWLALRGVPTLHASAIEIDGRGVGFLSASRGGKSTMAASFVKAGHRLISDDLLAIDLIEDSARALPAYPQMRMWPTEAEFFLGDAGELERIHPLFSKRWFPVEGSSPQEEALGSYRGEAVALSRLYLLHRRPRGSANSEVEIRPVGQKVDAVIELLRHLFAGRLLKAAGLEAEQRQRLARVAERVGVMHLDFPSGLLHLSRVRSAIVGDVTDPAMGHRVPIRVPDPISRS